MVLSPDVSLPRAKTLYALLLQGDTDTLIAHHLYKWLASTFVPDVAKNMDKEGTFNFGKNEEIDLKANPHVLIEDRGSDVTVFSFAGMAVLFAGLPAFEFKKLLHEQGDDFNLVFFRDVSRSAYTMTPDGKEGGPEFYRAEVERVMRELGSKYNVSIGASAGGAMAFYMAMSTGMDQIVTFSPVLHRDVYTDPRFAAYNLFNLPKLVTEPQAYAEVSLMTLAALALKRKVQAEYKTRLWRNVSQFYCDMEESRPHATVYYGKRCMSDTVTAKRIEHLDEVRIVPVDTGRHNCAAILKRDKIMGDSILNEIKRVMKERGYERQAPAERVVQEAASQAS